MKTISFENEEAWLEARRGKITGTKAEVAALKRGGGRRKGYYELIADGLTNARDGENPMDRGHRLEEEAMLRLAEKIGKKVDVSLKMWQRDDDASIAYSPDGIIDKKTAAECKCLSSASHIEAYLTHKVPDDYEYQVLQAFIVNDDLRKLYFCFYDPSFGFGLDFFFIEITRESLQKQIEDHLQLERETLAEIREIVNRLSF